MPSEVDKAYVKKHKINDMLNELYVELTSQKPENPVMFAFKHFEKKIPQDETLSDQPNFNLMKSLTKASGGTNTGPEEKMPAPAGILFSKIFNKVNTPANNENNTPAPGADQAVGSGGGLFALSTINIINKLSRINARINNEPTSDELLEKEKIIFTKSKSDKYESAPSKQMVSYKNDLINRQNALKHKRQLRDLVNQELDKPETARIFGVVVDSEDEERPSSKAMYDDSKLREEENDELKEEILTAQNYNPMINKDKPNRRKFRKLNAFAAGLRPGMDVFPEGIDLKATTLTPRVTLMICQICSKIQNNQMIEKNDLTNRDFQSIVNQDVKTAPILSTREPIRLDKIGNQTPKQQADASTPQEQNPLASNQFILDFFKESAGPNKAKNSDNLDDGPIESASQVSGPRHIEPFELPTNRKDSDRPGLGRRESGVLAWVMARQLSSQGKEENIEEQTEKKSEASTLVGKDGSGAVKEKVSSRPGSAVGRGSKSGRSAVDDGRRETARDLKEPSHEQQAWKIKESDSDVSSLTRKQAKQPKN